MTIYPKEHNGFKALFYLYFNRNKYLQMALDHQYAQAFKHTDPSMVASEKSQFEISLIRQKVESGLLERGDELKRGLNFSLKWTFYLSITPILLALLIGILDISLPFDTKKVIFFLATFFAIFSAAISVAPKPESYDGNTLAEHSHSLLKKSAYFITAFMAIFRSLM